MFFCDCPCFYFSLHQYWPSPAAPFPQLSLSSELLKRYCAFSITHFLHEVYIQMPVALLFWCTFHTDGSVCIPYTLVLYLFLHIDDCTSFLGIYIVPYLCMPFLIGTLIQVTLHLFVFILDYLTNYLFFVICAFRIYNASLHVFLW